MYMNLELPFASVDGAQTFSAMNSYYGGPTHVDIRSVFPHKFSTTANGKNDRIYYANDGGISLKPTGKIPNNPNVTININGKGLNIGHYLGFGSSEHEGMIVTGAFHNGVHAFEPLKYPKWIFNYTSDAYEGLFNAKDRKLGYGQEGFGYVSLINTVQGINRNINSFGGGFGLNIDSKIEIPIPTIAHNNGDLYTGQVNMYKKEYSSNNFNSLPENTVLGLPVVNDPDWGIQPARDMIFSPYRTDLVGYIVFATGQLYYRNPPVNANFTLIPSSPALTSKRPPTSLAIDPRLPEHVWMSLGSINWAADARERVMYSPNAGNNWFDISKNLPRRLPVTKVTHQEGSNYIFASTDVGIYRADMSGFSYSNISDINSAYNSVEWYCFNQGISGGPDYPIVYTSDIEINYCSGKIITSTYGRSLWASDLYPGSQSASPTEIITTNTQWNDTKYINTGIRVTNNATLTISGSSTIVYMPKNGQIIIEPGAKLVVDGATITNSCESCFWRGILVTGNASQPQTASTQGSLEIKNGAIIEHALLAISNSDNINFSTASGGIINASNATFRNNKKSASINTYKNITNGVHLSDKSYFINCTFVIDDNFKGTATVDPFESHASLWESYGVKFTGCKFYNNNTTTQKGKGRGINSYNASYNVNPLCTSLTAPCTSFQRSEFKGTTFGILAEGDINTTNFVVDRADFDQVSIGVRVNSQQCASITRCLFDVGNGEPAEVTGCYQNIGIYNTNTQAFSIQENTFLGHTNTSQPSGWQNFGVVMEHSGENNKEVYKNTFTSLTTGCFALGKNRSSHTNNKVTGLRFLCNSFTSNITDIGVYGTAAAPYFEGIAWQGSSLSSAGNTFNSTTSTHVANLAMPIRYYHTGGNTKPTLVTPGFVTTVLGANAAACTSKLPTENPVALTADTRNTLKNDFFSWDAILKNAEGSFFNRLDGGNTADMLNYIAGQGDASEMESYMMAASPWLSETTLRALATSDVLPASMLQDVLTANPDALQDNAFMDFLQNSIPTPLEESVITELINSRETTTARTALQDTISNASYLSSEIAARLIRDIKGDSSSSYQVDSLPVWLQNTKELWAKYHLAGYYLNKGMFDEGDTVLAHIPQDYVLESEQQNEWGAFGELWAVLRPLYAAGRNIFSLTQSELTALGTVGENPEAQNLKIISLAIYYWVNHLTLFPCADVNLPPLRPSFSNIAGKKDNNLFNAYPNPARDYVVFDYNVPAAKNTLTLTVTNTLGQQVMQKPLSGNNGQTWWDTKEIQPGTFYIKLSDGSKSISTQKLIIIK